jgi:WD40 repeat protein
MFTFEHQGELRGHSDSINAMLLDQYFLFSASDDRSIRMWSVEELASLRVFDMGEKPIIHMVLLPDFGQLCCCNLASEVQLLDYPLERVARRFTVDRKDKVLSLCYIQELRKIFVGTEAN